MIKHVILIKLKNNSLEEKLKVKEVLLSMRGKVETIKAIEVGVDFLCSSRSYDVILQVLLENKEALDIYQKDEYHENVVKKYIAEVKESTIAVDYEL